MTLCLRDARLTAAFDDVQFTEAIPDLWIFSLFDLKKMTNPVHREVVPSMYHAIPEELYVPLFRKTEKSSPPDLEYWIGIILGFMQFT